MVQKCVQQACPGDTGPVRITYYLQLCQLPNVCRQCLEVVIAQVEGSKGRCNTIRKDNGVTEESTSNHPLTEKR